MAGIPMKTVEKMAEIINVEVDAQVVAQTKKLRDRAKAAEASMSEAQRAFTDANKKLDAEKVKTADVQRRLDEEIRVRKRLEITVDALQEKAVDVADEKEAVGAKA